ncbi:hypothetical protein ACWF62_10835 [Rhodococcus sp. NPDC054953]
MASTGAGIAGFGARMDPPDPGIAADLARRWAAVTDPIRIEVTGRAGVGRSALVAALGTIPGADIGATAAWDKPGVADPVLTGDVVVLVLLDPPRRSDRDCAAAAGARPVLVLGKADTVGDAAGAAARVSAEFRTECLPVTAVGDIAGVETLREVLVRRVAAARTARAAALLALLRASARDGSRRDHVESFLASDDGVRLAALAAAVSDPAGPDAVGTGSDRDRARQWRVRRNTAPDAASARAALALHRAAVRDGGHRA